MLTQILCISVSNNQKLQLAQMSWCDWLNKRRYIHMMVYYSGVKNNEMLVHVTIRIALQGVMLSKKKQRNKN